VQVLESIRDLFKHGYSLGLHLITNGLSILGVLVGFQEFAPNFLDEALS